MKCGNCGKYTFDEHYVCVTCAETIPRILCTCDGCGVKND
jgi:hypothetical protein